MVHVALEYDLRALEYDYKHLLSSHTRAAAKTCFSLGVSGTPFSDALLRRDLHGVGGVRHVHHLLVSPGTVRTSFRGILYRHVRGLAAPSFLVL